MQRRSYLQTKIFFYVFLILQIAISDVTCPIAQDTTECKTFSCKDGNERELKVDVLSNVSPDKDCSTDKKTNLQMFEDCKTFCGLKQSIPLVIGSPNFGFDFNDARQICLPSTSDRPTLTMLPPKSILKYNPAILERCQHLGDTMNRFEDDFSTLLSIFRRFRYAKLKLIDTYNRSFTQIRKRNSREEIIRIKGLHKSERLQHIISSARETFRLGNSETEMLKDIANELDDQMKIVAESLEKSIKNFKENIKPCNDVFLKINEGNFFMKDICKVAGRNCLNYEESEHVSCCCGYVPLSDFGEKDICEEAKIKSQHAINLMKIPSVILQKNDDLHKKMLRTMCDEGLSVFSAKFDNHNGRSVCNTTIDSSHDDRTALKPFHTPRPGHSVIEIDSSCDKILSSRKRDQRCQDLLCEGQGSDGDAGRVHLYSQFWNKSSNKLCGDLMDSSGQPKWPTTYKLFDTCKDEICPRSIPLLIGATEFGFNVREASQVCLGNDVFNFSRTQLSDCNSLSTRSNCAAHTMVDLIVSFRIFKYSQLKYKYDVAKKVNAAVKTILHPETTRKIQLKTPQQRIEAMEDIYRNLTSSIKVDTSEQLSESAFALERAFQNLRGDFEESIISFLNFIENCNQMFTTPSDDDKTESFITNLCSNSDSCFEENDADHVSCCCVQNPLLGEIWSMLDDGAILNDGEFDMCQLADIETERLAEENHFSDDVIQAYVESMKHKYGESYKGMRSCKKVPETDSPTTLAERCKLSSARSIYQKSRHFRMLICYVFSIWLIFSF